MLEALIDRANYNTEVCRKLIKDLAKSEELELHRGYGRIESRKRFKKQGVGAPLLEKRARNLLYIDESGKSVPQPLTFQHPPFFALGAVAMQQEEVDNYCAAADEIKLNVPGLREQPQTNSVTTPAATSAPAHNRSTLNQALFSIITSNFS